MTIKQKPTNGLAAQSERTNRRFHSGRTRPKYSNKSVPIKSS